MGGAKPNRVTGTKTAALVMSSRYDLEVQAVEESVVESLRQTPHTSLLR